MSDYYEDTNNGGYEVSEKQVGKFADKLERGIDAALDKEISSIITNKSIICGLCCVIPFFGFETIIYAICLWGMYGQIADKAKTPFRKNLFSNITGGFVVNLVIVGVLNFICEFFTFAGGLGLIMSFFVGYLGTKTSGAAFVGMLKLMHGKRAKAKFDVGAGIQAAFSNGNSNNQLPQNNYQQTSPSIGSENMSREIPSYVEQSGTVQQFTIAQAPPPVPNNQCSSSSLVTCPDCGRQVSRRAECCPECGCPVSEM